ncbi:MAG TPA: RHS repeat-associated core domain-containing protein [Gammaproteobacteria bacterium]|nr:RHS repeat-associated core domain-containing protein [Gammaproteobacteria bacterium]
MFFNADRYGFTHQEMLDNVGIIHMNGRIYDPNLGRFLSVDPVFEFPTNTQSLNPYSYVLNNPLSLTDPTGYTATDGSIYAGPGGATRGCEGQDELPLIFLPAFSGRRAAGAMRLSSAGR